MKAILNASCAGLGDYIYDDIKHWCTPISCMNDAPENRRGYEIKEWIRANDTNMKMFIILDDDSDIAPYQDYFVKCDPYDGLTFQAYLKARALLGDK